MAEEAKIRLRLELAKAAVNKAEAEKRETELAYESERQAYAEYLPLSSPMDCLQCGASTDGSSVSYD